LEMQQEKTERLAFLVQVEQRQVEAEDFKQRQIEAEDFEQRQIEAEDFARWLGVMNDDETVTMAWLQDDDIESYKAQTECQWKPTGDWKDQFDRGYQILHGGIARWLENWR
jgi:hypothetical protein